jgi:Asp-tRNA(Asn)/Glu-tRNA(Gln) amidotransferase A subunit family amidase
MMGASGMPVGVQIVGWPGKDEMVLRVMREIQDKSKFKLPLQFVL